MSNNFHVVAQSGTYNVHANELAQTNGFSDQDQDQDQTNGSDIKNIDDDIDEADDAAAEDEDDDEQNVVVGSSDGHKAHEVTKDAKPQSDQLPSTGQNKPKQSHHHQKHRQRHHNLAGGYNALVGGLSQAIQAKLSQVRRHSASSSSPIPGLASHSGIPSMAVVAPPPETIKCVVHFLDDTRQVFEVDRMAKGEQLMELVFRHLELIEREYFALQFTEQYPGHGTQSSSSQSNGNPSMGPATIHQQQLANCASSTTSTNSSSLYNSHATSSNRWLDPTKKIRKQMRFCSSTAPFLLHFRVKFYVSEISRLFEEYTRYHFYLQIRKDILAGRLTATSGDIDGGSGTSSSESSWMATLASYVLQSELGDYCEEDHPPGYSSQFRFIPNQTREFEMKVESLHRLHQGQTPADAELNYLEEAKNLDLYGVDLHLGKDCAGQDIQIGVCANGLIVFKNGIKINTFSWAKIVKISFKRRLFFVQLKHEGTERFDNMVGFNLCSYRACKALWKSCVEQHTFFRLHTPKPLTKKFFFFFSLGSKFRYSGKTEFQTIEENKKRLTRTERIFIRNNSRNATMPAVKLNDAQRHINNLKLTSSSGGTVNPSNQSMECGTQGKNKGVGDVIFEGSVDQAEVEGGGSCSKLDSSMVITNGNHHRGDDPAEDVNYENRHNITEDITCEDITHSSSGSPPPPFSATRSLTKLFSSVITSARHRGSSSSYSCSNPEVDLHPHHPSSVEQLPGTSRNHGGGRHQSIVPAIVRSLTRSAAHTKNSILSQTKSKFTSKSFSSSASSSAASSSTSSSSSSSSASGLCVATLPKKQDLVRSSTSCDNIIQSSSSSTSKPAAGTIAQLAGISTGQIVVERINSSKVSSLPVTLAAYSPSATISLPFIDQDSNNQNSSNGKLTGSGRTVGSSLVISNNVDITTKLATSIDTHPEITVSSVSTTVSPTETSNQPEIDSPIRELIKELYDVAAAVMDTSSSDQQQPEPESPVHLVTITMKPDSDGRFGFNVKGGHDQNCPVLVSRVAPNTPADNMLHEGDQVISINGNLVSGLKHEEVVQLIRSTKNNGPDAELVLSIRPNVYHDQCTDCVEEPPFQYTLASQCLNSSLSSSSTVGPVAPSGAASVVSSLMSTFNGLGKGSHPTKQQQQQQANSSNNRNSLNAEPMNSLLDISMNLLQEGLLSESLIAQFEQLPRRNENEPITISRYVENIPKNRYLDIAPYDSTRVVLHECITGDYINASFVDMVIPGSHITNRYIASQGPLKRTTSDFWQMIWEQRCPLIVMVTPLVEDGRKKCYKYWPDQDGHTMMVNERLELTLESCWDEVAFVERTFKLTDPETDESHTVSHLQYLAWPDQGVPDDDEDFLKLINKVRKLRQYGPNAPVVVHCSAGIGRTGVLILMECGICLIEANQPIYPLELVRTMRNYRAMLIQTTSQFRFVCEALYHVYRDRVVEPLPLYRKPTNAITNTTSSSS